MFTWIYDAEQGRNTNKLAFLRRVYWYSLCFGKMKVVILHLRILFKYLQPNVACTTRHRYYAILCTERLNPRLPKRNSVSSYTDLLWSKCTVDTCRCVSLSTGVFIGACSLSLSFCVCCFWQPNNTPVLSQNRWNNSVMKQGKLHITQWKQVSKWTLVSV